MKAFLTAALAGALLAQAGAATAQRAKPKAATPAAAPAAKPRIAAAPTTAELQEAIDTLSLLASAFNSKDIPNQTKAGLMLCLYGNPLGKITRGAAQMMAADKTIDAKSPSQRLLVIAALCGAPVPAPKDAAALTPATPDQPAAPATEKKNR